MTKFINVKDSLEETKLELLNVAQDCKHHFLQICKEELTIIKKCEKMTENLTNEQKKEHFISVLQYSDGVIVFEFKWTLFDKYNIFEEIIDIIKISLCSISLELNDYKAKRKLTNDEILRHRKNLRQFYLKEYNTGDYYQDISDFIPEMTFYNFLGEYDKHLTIFAKKEKERQINEIVQQILYTPPSLKKLAYPIALEYVKSKNISMPLFISF